MIERLAALEPRRLGQLGVALFAMLLGGGLYLVLPAFKEYRRHAAEHAAQALAVRSAASVIPDQQRAARELEVLQRRQASEESAASMVNVMLQLQAAAASSRARLGAVLPLREPPSAGFVPLSFDVEARGRYAELAGFVAAAEANLPDFTPTAVRIGPTGEGEDLLLKLRVTAYLPQQARKEAQ